MLADIAYLSWLGFVIETENNRSALFAGFHTVWPFAMGILREREKERAAILYNG
jgi:hypothetical protein